MDHQIELGYLVLEVPDPDTLAPVFADVVGLVPGEPTASGVGTWRNDQRANRLFVQRGPANDAIAIGFEAVDSGAFDAVIARLQKIDADVADGDGSERRVQQLVRAKAPWGVDVEVVLSRPTHRARSILRWSLAVSSPRVSGSGTLSSPRPRSTSPTCSSLTASVSPSRTGSRPSSRRASTSRFGSTIATRRHHTIALARAPFDLPQTPAPHHVRDQRARRRRSRLRSSVGH